jgi:hypothetical protein
MIFDSGLFVLLLGFGFMALLISFRVGELLKLLSVVCFFTLAIVMFADYDVAYIETFSGATSTDCPTATPCTTTKYLIQDNQGWLAWIFMAFGLLSALLFFLEMIGFNDNAPKEGF